MTHKLTMLKGALLPLMFMIAAGCSQGDSDSAASTKPAEQLAPPEKPVY